MFTVGKK